MVRVCPQHRVALIEDTLTCPRGQHPVRKWLTLERGRLSSPAAVRVVGEADIDELGIKRGEAKLTLKPVPPPQKPSRLPPPSSK